MSDGAEPQQTGGPVRWRHALRTASVAAAGADRHRPDVAGLAATEGGAALLRRSADAET